jgi:hypothetical protein
VGLGFLETTHSADVLLSQPEGSPKAGHPLNELKAGAMSIRLMSMVFEATGVTSTEKLILLALADHANDEGKHIYPSIETLCRKTSLSYRAIWACLKKMSSDECGLLIMVHPPTQHFPAEYAISPDVLSSYIQSRPERDSTLEETRPARRSTQTGTSFHPDLHDVPSRLARRSSESLLTIKRTIIEPMGPAEEKKPDQNSQQVWEEFRDSLGLPVSFWIYTAKSPQFEGVRDGQLVVAVKDKEIRDRLEFCTYPVQDRLPSGYAGIRFEVIGGQS